MSLDATADTLEGLENLMQQKIGNIHTCLPGTILSFDASACLASVKSTLKNLPPTAEFLNTQLLTVFLFLCHTQERLRLLIL